MDAAFFYGYMVTQIPGGVIANKIPANKLFGIAVGGSAFLNLFVPAAAQYHYGAVMFIRILQGLIEVSRQILFYQNKLNRMKPSLLSKKEHVRAKIIYMGTINGGRVKQCQGR